MSAELHARGEQSSTYLSQAQIEGALTYLADNWPHQQILPAMREGWLDILCQLHEGELKPALATMPGRFRPDPYSVLEVVMGQRSAHRAKAQLESDELDRKARTTYQRTGTAEQEAEKAYEQCAAIGIGRRAKERNLPKEDRP